MGVGNGGAPTAAATYQILQASGTTIVKGAPGVFYGATNLGTLAQITPVTCYDNASAASGNVIYFGTLSLGGSTYPPRGVYFTQGLTCSTAATLLSNGVAIYYI